jgi:NAD(P)-dependent dehydrogenase (short-subunit alcohol dehydrogenase family)
MELTGKVAVITGAGSGIGRGLAKRLADAGMKLVLSGYNLGPLEATASELSSFDTEIICVPTDVSKLAAVQALADAVIARFGQVHLLCNNAGVAVPGPVGEISMADWRWVLSINLWGPIHGVQVFLPIMERQGAGHICSTASESGLYATSHLGAYNVSKFGVVGLMTSLERDLRARNSPVTASVFCPGAVATAITSSSRNRSSEDMATLVESEKTRQFWKAVCDAVAAGMDPNDAAGFVVEAIRNNRFWIFSHPHVPATALRQARAMAESQELIDL